MNNQQTRHNDRDKRGKMQYRIWRSGGGGYVKVIFGKNLIGGGTSQHDKDLIHNALTKLCYRSSWMKEQCQPYGVIIHVRNGLHIANDENIEHITFDFEYAGGEGRSKHYHGYYNRDTRSFEYITCRQYLFGQPCIERITGN